MNVNQSPRTICWDCSRACGDCPWSSEAQPVEGWSAMKTQVKLHCETARREPVYTDSYVVLSCPMFSRDSYEYGLYWANKKNQIVRRKKKKP